MRIEDFCEHNNHKAVTLAELETIFGKSNQDGMENCFGQVMGKVINCFVNQENNREMVEMVFLDDSLKELKWDGENIKFVRTNVGKRMTINQCYSQSLFYYGKEIFTRNPHQMKEDVSTESIYTLKDELENQGYHCNIKVLAQFLLGLDTHQILILHGACGMGKTSFVSHIAKTMGFEYKIIPVRPNWMDGQDLFGYYNPVDHRYYSTPFLDALCEAKENPKSHYLICLDEMNLAHVEYYFSDVLSAMESNEAIPLYAMQEWYDALERFDFILNTYDKNSLEWLEAKMDKKNLTERYTPCFKLPNNVTFVGTLNMDATTNDLSPKVIDRSCIIKVIKDTHDSLKAFETTSQEDSFIENLLMALNKQMSIRVQRQMDTMKSRLDSEYLKGILSKQDFLDMLLVMKVLPSLNIEDVDCYLDEEEFRINDFLIYGKNVNWQEKYPLSVECLIQMCNAEEKTLNYWRT